MAKAYMGMGMEDEVISCLEKATHHSIKYDVRENGMYTAFVVNRMEDDTFVHRRPLPKMIPHL
jgi:hypothetical protein